MEAVVIILWMIAATVGAILTGHFVRLRQENRAMMLLCGIAGFYLLSDLLLLGGFKFGGFIDFPIFLGIGACIVWFVIWLISASIGRSKQ